LKRLHTQFTCRIFGGGLKIALFLSFLLPYGVFAEIDSVRPGRLTIGSRHSESDQQFLTDAWMTIWHDHQFLLAGNLRGGFGERNTQQLSGGLALRYLARDENWIFGVNAFGDRARVASGNRFHQVGGGVEVLSRWLDLRMNYYYPLTDPRCVDESSVWQDGTACRRGVRQRMLIHAYEEAIEGADAEIGVWIPWVDAVAPTAFYVGYARFSPEHTETLDGFQGRMESRLHPNLTVDAIWYENRDVQRSDYYAGIRVDVPLDFWNGWRNKQPQQGGVRHRLNESVQREWMIHSSRVVDGVVHGVDEIEDRRRPVPPPEEPIPNCFLDSEGEVVCE